MYRGVDRQFARSLAHVATPSFGLCAAYMRTPLVSPLPPPPFSHLPRAQPSVDHSCTQPLARLHAPYALALSRSFALCTVARHPLQSYRKRPRIRILLRALYVHRTGRVYVLTVYICIIQCSRERYSEFVEELAVGQRTLATQAESVRA